MAKFIGLLKIFIVAFLLNLAWENLHSLLYDNYMGGEITGLILLRASLVDACIITLIVAPFVFSILPKKYDWTIIFAGVAVAVLIECWALGTGRWAYNSLMPIIPLLNTGLTPTIQLGLLGWVSYTLAYRRHRGV